MAVALARDARIARRHEILNPDGVGAVHADGESQVPPVDDLAREVARADPATRARAGHIELASRRLEHRPIAVDETQPGEDLRGYPIVIVAFGAVGDRAGGAESDTAEGRALQCHVVRE